MASKHCKIQQKKKKQKKQTQNKTKQNKTKTTKKQIKPKHWKTLKKTIDLLKPFHFFLTKF